MPADPSLLMCHYASAREAVPQIDQFWLQPPESRSPSGPAQNGGDVRVVLDLLRHSA